MNLYEMTVPGFLRLLGQAHRWLDQAQTHADQKKFDVRVLLEARLAPDQFAFTRQIQIMTDHAKGSVARLAGIAPPAFEDNERTVEELRARLAKTADFLKTITPAQLEGGETRNVTLPSRPGKAIKGGDYLLGHALPNLYFHATTAYSILRHNGVDVGKAHFIGDLPWFDA